MPTLPHLDLHLYAANSITHSGRQQSVAAVELNCVAVVDIDQSRMPASFESVAERLSKLERMFFELDGSFVCTGNEAGQPWQLDGMLYDRRGHVQRLELLGCCPLAVWHQILDALRAAPASGHVPTAGEPIELVAHLRRQGCFVTVQELERLWLGDD